MEGKKYKHFERVFDHGDDMICFRTSCACSSKNHTIDLFIEYDRELKISTIAFNTYCSLRMKHHSYHSDDNCIKRFFTMLKDRILMSFKILFVGYFRLDEEFIFKDREQIEELIDIINTFSVEVDSRTHVIDSLRKRIEELESDRRNPTN